MPATYTANKALFRSRRRLLDYDIDAALNLVDLGMPQGAGNKCVPIASSRPLRGRPVPFRRRPRAVTKFQIIAATARTARAP
jgi:hypothetical protein